MCCRGRGSYRVLENIYMTLPYTVWPFCYEYCHEHCMVNLIHYHVFFDTDRNHLRTRSSDWLGRSRSQQNISGGMSNSQQCINYSLAPQHKHIFLLLCAWFRSSQHQVELRCPFSQGKLVIIIEFIFHIVYHIYFRIIV